MKKAELESKHLAELHTLAAEVGVDRYRMLSRDELIDALADDSGGGGGGGSQRKREPRQRRESGGGGGGGRGGGRERRPRREPGGGSRERKPRGDRQRRRPEGRPDGEREAAPTPPQSGGGSEERPKRSRRRRRFGRRGRKTVRAQDILLPAVPGRQALVYAETRAGCTALLRELAAELAGGRGPDPVALLVDPSPEELAEWKREAPKAEIVSAGQERHAEDALAQAVRRAESGEAVVFLIDSLSRAAEEFGGAKFAKELFDAGQPAGGGAGSLTIVAALERPA